MKKYGFFVALTLVALRVGLGWLFFTEGVTKLKSPTTFSAGFFSAAQGPLAGKFQELIWDRFGLARLQHESTLQAWEDANAKTSERFEFDEAKSKQAQLIFNRYKSRLELFHAENYDALAEYRLQAEQLMREMDETNNADAAMREVYSLSGQLADRQGDLLKQVGPWLTTIDSLWSGYERELSELAGAPGKVKLTRPGRRWVDSESIDKFIRCFDATIGILLVVGLLTRPAALAAALFLVGVVVTQPPWLTNAATYQIVTLFGLLVVAATGAGQFAGLDFFARQLRLWCCPPKRGESS